MRVQIYRLLVIMYCSTNSNSMNQPSKIVNPARRQMRVQIYRLLVIMYCSTNSNSMNQPSKIVNPARRQLNRETVFFLSAFAPENLVSREGFGMLCVCCVFSSHSFWTSSSLDVPAGVTQKGGDTGVCYQ